MTLGPLCEWIGDKGIQLVSNSLVNASLLLCLRLKPAESHKQCSTIVGCEPMRYGACK